MLTSQDLSLLVILVPKTQLLSRKIDMSCSTREKEDVIFL